MYNLTMDSIPEAPEDLFEYIYLVENVVIDFFNFDFGHYDHDEWNSAVNKFWDVLFQNSINTIIQCL